MFNSTPNIDSATVVVHDDNKTQAERGTGEGKGWHSEGCDCGSDSGGAYAGNLASNTCGYPCAHTREQRLRQQSCQQHLHRHPRPAPTSHAALMLTEATLAAPATPVPMTTGIAPLIPTL